MKAREIAEFLNAELIGDGDVDIVRVAALESATKGEIAFVERSDIEIATNAACLIVPHGFAQQTGAAQIAVPNPKLAFALVAAEVHPPKKRGAGIHPTAVIAETATIGKDVFIGAFVCVGENSIIGDNSQILAGTRIGDGVNVGGSSVLSARYQLGSIQETPAASTAVAPTMAAYVRRRARNAAMKRSIEGAESRSNRNLS